MISSTSRYYRGKQSQDITALGWDLFSDKEQKRRRRKRRKGGGAGEGKKERIREGEETRYFSGWFSLRPT